MLPFVLPSYHEFFEKEMYTFVYKVAFAIIFIFLISIQKSN